MYLVNVFLVIEDEGEKDNIDEETKTFQNEFPNLFSRNGKITNHDLKIKPNAMISQQKVRRIPIQMQKAVDAEIKRLLKDGHIEKVNDIKEDVFIQPTVMINGLVSENDPALQLEEDDFSPDVISTVLIRERTCGTKFDGTFKKKKCKVVGESSHTITMVPNR